MTTVTIAYDDLVRQDRINGPVVFPVIESDYRAYGNYAELDSFTLKTEIIDNAPAYIYLTGSAGVTAYDVPNPLLQQPYPGVNQAARYFISVGHPDLGNFGAVDTADQISVAEHADNVYVGPGNDNISDNIISNNNVLNTASKLLVGGSGDDTIQAGYGADILYGDFADAPVFVTNTQWQTPASADPAVVEGSDYLNGNYGPDTLYGGGGDDVLVGDPDTDNSYDNQDELYRGDGNDHLMGGTAADSLMGDDGDDLLMGQRAGDTLLSAAQREGFGHLENADVA